MAATRKRSREEISDGNDLEQDKENQPASKVMRLNNNSRKEISNKAWNCHICTFENIPTATKCAMCEQPHHSSSSSSSSSPSSIACNSFLCVVCKENYGFDLNSCSHKLCVKCAKEYITSGLDTNQWMKEPLNCPSCKSTNDSIIPSFLIKQCNLSEDETKNLDDQQTYYTLKITSLCTICNLKDGEELQCQHMVCIDCCKKYLLKGVATNKWKKQALYCPVKECKIILNNRIISKCEISTNMKNRIESMQNEYIKSTDPTIISCPKCMRTYSTEYGDIKCENKNEKGINGEILSLIHKQHKTKYRFRCSNVKIIYR